MQATSRSFPIEVFTETNEKTRVLRDKLVRIGKLEARLARYRTSLLGIGRVVGFVQHRAPDWIDEETMACIKVLANDLKTLDQFDEQLTGKLQFLQDAVLGFINTDQNAVMKLLTVASVVTIPPVILAGDLGHELQAHARAGQDLGLSDGADARCWSAWCCRWCGSAFAAGSRGTDPS